MNEDLKEERRLKNKAWRRQVERVIDGYVGEVEYYRKEVKELQAQIDVLRETIQFLKVNLR